MDSRLINREILKIFIYGRGNGNKEREREREFWDNGLITERPKLCFLEQGTDNRKEKPTYHFLSQIPDNRETKISLSRTVDW